MRSDSLRMMRIRSVKLAAAIMGLNLWSAAALAAEPCITKPSLPAGVHWTYRIDWSNHRRCWYVEQIAASRTSVKTHASRKPAASRPPAKQPDQRVKPGDQENVDALFREFQQWRERQIEHAAADDRASRDAVFQEFLQWQQGQSGATR